MTIKQLLQRISLFILLPSSLCARVIFVNIDAPCSADCNGVTWTTAFKDLQQAIAVASENDEIWVAQGTYLPHSTSRQTSFYLSKDVVLLGGFRGNEAKKDRRNPKKYLTVLSGDIGEEGNPMDNSYAILLTVNLSTATLIDGFTISDGNANHMENLVHENGGGWVNMAFDGATSSPTVRNCIFENNRAIGNGGAFYNDGKLATCSPLVKDCVFRNNSAKFGGAVFNNANAGQCNPTFLNCQFIENIADQDIAIKGTGGVMYSFTQNKGGSKIRFANCLFWKNRAYNGGGLYSLTGQGKSVVEITNCTFYQNTANVGGVIYLNAAPEGNNLATILNSILWQSDGGFNRHFHFSGKGSPKITLNASIVDATDCLELSAEFGDVICNNHQVYFNLNPEFKNPARGDFHLKSISPAIDKGNDLAIRLLHLEEDFEGDLRASGQKVDLGMDESISFSSPFKASYQSAIFYQQTDLQPLHQSRHQSALNLTPNPVDDYLYLQLDEDLEGIFSFGIFNMLGKQVQSSTLKFIHGRAKIDLNPDLPSGMYILVLENYPGSHQFVKALK